MTNHTNAARCARLSPAIGAALLLLASPAAAQEREGERRPDRIVTIGLGAEFGPRYPGSDEISFSPFPDFGLRREGEEPAFEAGDESAGFGILRAGPIAIGPAIAIVGSRRGEDVGAPIGDVGVTVEAGAFVEAFLTEHLRLRGEVRRGIGGHESWVGDLSADFVLHLAETSHLAIGPRVRIGDDRFMDTYFGVGPAVAAAAGLPQFNPSGGIWSVGATASFNTQLNENWGLYGYARYDRLTGGASESPIVQVHGSRDAFAVGLGLNYSFRLRSR
jgi:outer membrane protein